MTDTALTPETVGLRIKAARNAKLWTQVQFAHHALVSPSSIARWERGILPPLRELVRVAAVLDIAPDTLVEMPTKGSPSDERLDRIEALLTAIARKLDVTA